MRILTTPLLLILTTQFGLASAETVAFRTQKGSYLVAENGQVNANSSQIGRKETFEIIDVGNGEVVLKTQNSRYVVAEGAGGGALNANRTEIGSWEKFTIVPQPQNKVCLRTQDGHFVAAEGGGRGQVNADRQQCQGWEQFVKIKVDTPEKWDNCKWVGVPRSRDRIISAS